MNLLVLNPDITRKVTDRVAQAARAAASPGTEVVSATGRSGGKVIGSRSENAIAAHACLELAAMHAKGYDEYRNLQEMLLAFSGKRREFCPSCADRRMAQTAVHLVEQMIPWVPTRQWVVSVPIPLW